MCRTFRLENLQSKAEGYIREYRFSIAGQTHYRESTVLARAALYLAVRQEGTVCLRPVDLADTDLSDGLCYVRDILRVYCELIAQGATTPPLANLEACATRFFGAFQSSPEIEARTMDILDSAKRDGLTQGKKSMSIAAAAFYLANLVEKNGQLEAGDPTQDSIAAVAKMSSGGLRLRIYDLEIHVKSFKSSDWHLPNRSRGPARR